MVKLDAYSGLFDEGIRTEQLYLMSWGYRPFRDIFAAQGPLLLDCLYPVYAVTSGFLGHSLVAARLVAVVYSLVGIAGLYWLAGQLGGRLAAVAAALLLAISPLYLEGSRLALAEVPALAPAIVAVAAATRYGQRGGFAWLLVAGGTLTVSLLMKPITVAAVPAVAAAAALRGRSGVRSLAMVGLLMLLASVAVVFLLGFDQVLEQIVQYRDASREAEGWSLRKNIAALGRGLGYEPLALLPFAAIGALLAASTSRIRTLPALLWAVGGLALLLVYSPLHGKHIVVAVPGLALMAGLAMASIRKLASRYASNAGVLACLVAALVYGVTLLPVFDRAGDVLKVTADTEVDPAFEQYADAVQVIAALTNPEDFIVTDHPYLAFLAGRRVPPELVDTSKSRIRARSLRASQAQALAEAYNPKLVVLWSDRLRGLRAFKDWTEAHYRVVKLYNRREDLDRLVYLRLDGDFGAARQVLAGSPSDTLTADFAEEMRLVGSSLDRTELRPGEGATVTLHWQLLRPTAVDYHAVTYLRATDDDILDDQEESLGGGSAGTADWTPGRWVIQSSFVKAARELEPGSYRVTVGLYDSRAKTLASVSSTRIGSGESEIEIGRINVALR